ncbi:MAG: DUF5615 family PIN-like protein [Planctomycetota bacterium]
MPKALWVDAQLSPAIAGWLPGVLGVPAHSLRELGLRDASDTDIFLAARAADAVVLTKDADFRYLLEQRGAPPRVIWLTCGNTSNAALRMLIERHAPSLRTWLAGDEPLIEVNG